MKKAFERNCAEELESKIIKQIASSADKEDWELFIEVDAIVQQLASDTDERLINVL